MDNTTEHSVSSETALKDEQLQPLVADLLRRRTNIGKDTEKLPLKKRFTKFKAVMAAVLLGLTLNSAQDQHPTFAEVGQSTVVKEAETVETFTATEVSGPQGITLIDVASDFDTQSFYQKWEKSLAFHKVDVDPEHPDMQRLLTDDDYAKSVLLEMVLDSFGEHGEHMQQIINNQAQFDENDQMQSFALQDAISEMYFYRDVMGNPTVGVRIDQQKVSQMITQTESPIISMSFQIGVLEFTAVAQERVVPDFHAYTVNGEEVFAQEENLVVKEVNGAEILMIQGYKSVDTLSLPTDQRIKFLVEEVDTWTQDEYEFLLEQKAITEQDVEVFGDEYINWSPAYAYTDPYMEAQIPKREGPQSTKFSLPTEKPATVYSGSEAAQLQAQGIVLTKDKPQEQRTEAYSPGAVFKTPTGEVTAEQNIDELYQLAQAHPDKILVAAIGNVDSAVLSTQQRPENLIIVGLYRGEYTLPGADIYVMPDKEQNIGSSSASTAAVSGQLSNLLEQGIPLTQLKNELLKKTVPKSVGNNIDTATNGIEVNTVFVLTVNKVTPQPS